MLAKADVVRNSPVVNIAKLPVTIALEIVKIPAELLQLKIDTTEKQKELADLNLANLQAYQTAYAEAQLAEQQFAQLEGKATTATEKTALFRAWANYLSKASIANVRAQLAGVPAPFDLAAIQAREPALQ